MAARKYISRFTSCVSHLLVLAFCTLLISACQSNNQASELGYSGVIEATQVKVVAEVGGRILELGADEGDAAEAGQVLVKLDEAALQAQVKQAQAAVSAAQANLAQVKAGTRKEEIDAAQAALRQAQADRDGASQAYQDTVKLLNNPQQLLAQTDAARTGVKQAEQAVAIAQAKLAEARWWRDFYDDDPGRHESLDKQIAIAQRNLEAAQAQLEGAKSQLQALEAMRAAPVTLQAQVNGARNSYSMTLASVNVAEAALAESKAGAAAEEIALAEARLHQAQAQFKLAQAYLVRAVVRAPLSGVVLSRSARVGETAQPGAALMTLANLDEVTLVIYVPQTDLPRVRVGDRVQVTVDAYPGQVFDGQVSFIARQAQFTPRDTQAKEDRAKVVFAVKVRLPNTDHRLKAGMTGDAVIETQAR
jgi:HlyD family secretion protein